MARVQPQQPADLRMVHVLQASPVRRPLWYLEQRCQISRARLAPAPPFAHPLTELPA